MLRPPARRGIDAGLNLERPLVAIRVLGPEFEPGWRTQASGRQFHRFHISFVKVAVDPIGVAVKILHAVEGGAERDKRESLASAVINVKLVETGEQTLRVLKEMNEEIIEIGIVFEIAVEVIEVKENSSPTYLRMIGLVLIQQIDLAPASAMRSRPRGQRSQVRNCRFA